MKNTEMMWVNLVHLGANMWNEPGNRKGRENRSTPEASMVLRFNRKLWDDYMVYMKNAGINTLVLDIGEAMRYESHPELAVEGSWTHDQMREELQRLRGMGFEVIPKLNFSACHDIWLQEYSRMLSTKPYYAVCRDVINEVLEVFQPKYFHLGMDEETANNQRNFQHITVRTGELWWHDLYYLVDLVEKGNAQAWVWSDYCWAKSEEYVKNMPKSVIQNTWYYHNVFDDRAGDFWGPGLRTFEILDKNGFAQVPAGSNFFEKDNMELLTKYCAENLDTTRIPGYMQTVWEQIAEGWMDLQYEAVDKLKAAKDWLESQP